MVIAPGQTAIAPEGVEDVVHVGEHCPEHANAPGQECRAHLPGQHRSSLVGQLERDFLVSLAFDLHQLNRGLLTQPLGDQTRMAVNGVGQSFRGHRPRPGHGPIQTQLVADVDHGHSCGPGHVGGHFPSQLGYPVDVDVHGSPSAVACRLEP